MRQQEAMIPAMEWSEAAMLPARPRTLCGGAALRQLARAAELETAAIRQEKQPAPAADARDAVRRRMRQAAFAQIRRFPYRTNSCTT